MSSPTLQKLETVLINQAREEERMESYQKSLHVHERQANTLFTNIESSIGNIERLLSHMQEDIETHRTLIEMQRRRVEIITLYLVAATVVALALVFKYFG